MKKDTTERGTYASAVEIMARSLQESRDGGLVASRALGEAVEAYWSRPRGMMEAIVALSRGARRLTTVARAGGEAGEPQWIRATARESAHMLWRTLRKVLSELRRGVTRPWHSGGVRMPQPPRGIIGSTLAKTPTTSIRRSGLTMSSTELKRKLAALEPAREPAKHGWPGPAPLVLASNDWTIGFDMAVEQTERDLILSALARTKNNVTKAAHLLELTRKGLQLKIKRLRVREKDCGLAQPHRWFDKRRRGLADTSSEERELIVAVLEVTRQNVTGAARLLKISRRGLQLKMKRLCLPRGAITMGLDQPVDIEVPFKCTGRSKGVLLLVYRNLPIRCLAAKIPALLEVDVSDLDVGDAIKLKQIKIPEGVKVRLPEDQTIVVIA